MTSELSEGGIVRELAERACRRITRRVIRSLRETKTGMLSGDDSGLTNAWEEICVQVQGEEAIFWDMFDQMIRTMVAAEIIRLPEYKRASIWLQTPQGEEWDMKDEDKREKSAVAENDIIDYFTIHYVYSAASDWSNPRIRKYLY